MSHGFKWDYRLTPPGASRFVAYSNAIQNVVGNVVTQVALQVEAEDHFGEFAPGAAARFTPLTPGWYLFGWQVSWANVVAGQRVAAMLYVNGVAPVTYVPNAAIESHPAGTRLPGSAIFYADGLADFFELWCWHSEGAVVRQLGPNATFFWGHKLSYP